MTFGGPRLGMRGLWTCEGCGSSRMADDRPETHPTFVERRIAYGDGSFSVQVLHACSVACEAIIRLAPEAAADG